MSAPASAGSAAKPWYQHKLVLLGETAVGKSSIVLRYVKKLWSEYTESTIGAAFLTASVALDDITVKLEIWDTAGQERYHSLAPMYYRGAAAAIVVYDITNRDSFGRSKLWVQELQRQGKQNMVIVLVGNKLDLADQRQVESREGKAYVEEQGLSGFFECSAKTNQNVSDIFRHVARALPVNTGPPKPTPQVQLYSPDDQADGGKKKGPCC